MTPLERLLAEAIPTGTFGNTPPPTQRRQPEPDPDAARHRADLLAALDAAAADRKPISRRRHLRAVPGSAA